MKTMSMKLIKKWYLTVNTPILVIYWNLYFELCTKLLDIFADQLSWIDLNTLFSEMEYAFLFETFYFRLPISFAYKETSYAKVSNLCEWWKFTLQIMFFFFEWAVITIMQVKFQTDFHSYTELNGLVDPL